MLMKSRGRLFIDWVRDIESPEPGRSSYLGKVDLQYLHTPIVIERAIFTRKNKLFAGIGFFVSKGLYGKAEATGNFVPDDNSPPRPPVYEKTKVEFDGYIIPGRIIDEYYGYFREIDGGAVFALSLQTGNYLIEVSHELGILRVDPKYGGTGGYFETRKYSRSFQFSVSMFLWRIQGKPLIRER